EVAKRINERVSLAEMYRVMGELMVAKSAVRSGSGSDAIQAVGQADSTDDFLTQAEGWFHQAIETARQQDAKLWELLSATSLSRLYLKQNKRQDARRVLSVVYEWFTEGFNTESLREARALLNELQS